MHRIDGAGHVNHQFVNEDLATMRPPTEVTEAWLNAVQNEIANVILSTSTEDKITALNKLDNTQLKTAILQLIAENAPDLSGYIPRLTAAAPLPTQPIGVIWHDAYASLMFWREFTQNGANYKGYASVNLSQLIMPTFNEIPAGTLKVGINVEINDFPALYNGYRHFGQLVAPDIWAAGTLAVCDNGNGTFKMIDLRGWTARFFSDGSQVDAGRVAGSAQKSTTLSTRPLKTDINGNQGEIILDIKNPDTIKILPFAPFQKSTTYSTSQQAQECGFRVDNTAFFACVKF